jgi:acyl-CoA thioester hydrolase
MDHSDAFTACRTAVLPEWIDDNGRMSEAYYVLVFGYATDALLAAIGVDETYRRRHQCSLITLEAHLRYLGEVGKGIPLAVSSTVLDSDHKRLHLYHQLRREDSGEVLAGCELLLMFVDTESGKSADFPAAIGAEVARFKHRWPGRPAAAEIGRTIAIHR